MHLSSSMILDSPIFAVIFIHEVEGQLWEVAAEVCYEIAQLSKGATGHCVGMGQHTGSLHSEAYIAGPTGM